MQVRQERQRRAVRLGYRWIDRSVSFKDAQRIRALPFTSANTAAVQRFLPPLALDIFCKAASEAEQAAIDHNGCIRQGWAAVKSAGWEAPATGKKWVLKDDSGAGVDGPTGDSVHVDVPLGSGKKKKPNDKFETTAQVCKVDAGLGLVFGFAIICTKNGQPYFDTQDDNIPDDAMLKAATDFMQSERVQGNMHQLDGSGNPIPDGSVVFAFPLTSDIAKAMDIECDKTGLMVAIKPSPDILEKYQSGEYTGFSIGGHRVEDEEVAA
jgi:hypothetical protein